MKTLTSSILLAMTLVGASVTSAYADTTRDQVRAELAQSNAEGKAFNDATFPGPFPTTQGESRSQVRAELTQAKAEGKTFNDATYPGPFSQTSDVTRDEVRTELAQAKAEGWAFNDATYPNPGRNVPHQVKQASAQVASSTVSGNSSL
jgi:hypothetical protein